MRSPGHTSHPAARGAQVCTYLLLPEPASAPSSWEEQPPPADAGSVNPGEGAGVVRALHQLLKFTPRVGVGGGGVGRVSVPLPRAREAPSVPPLFLATTLRRWKEYPHFTGEEASPDLTLGRAGGGGGAFPPHTALQSGGVRW